MSKCRPHRWNVEDWLYPFTAFDDNPGKVVGQIECLNCDRILKVEDTSPSMRHSIADSIARGLYDGDEYDEVYHAVTTWFTRRIAEWNTARGVPA